MIRFVFSASQRTKRQEKLSSVTQLWRNLEHGQQQHTQPLVETGCFLGMTECMRAADTQKECVCKAEGGSAGKASGG